MNYYKLIQDNNIIGVATDANFLRFQPRHQVLEYAGLGFEEYLRYKGVLYRDSWMMPLQTEKYSFNKIKIHSIDQAEYDILREALDKHEVPQEVEPEIHIAPEIIDEEAEMTIDFVRSAKLSEMSRTCNQIIEAGFDITLNEDVEHFSLTTQDQLNLISLGAMAQAGMEPIPYHADGEICRFYSAVEMNQIVAAATAFKIYQTTYYNALKNYINSLETIEEISAITYGIELPEEYKSEVLKALENENK